MMCRDGHTVWDLVNQVQLLFHVKYGCETHCTRDLNGNLIDFVEEIDAGNVNSVALDDIDQFILSRVFLEGDIAAVDSVLPCMSQSAQSH